MIALKVYPDKTLWSAPDLTWDEAWATVLYWREWGIDCFIVHAPDDAIDFELDEEEETRSR
jgi:hypothetical protein